ncbi:MAG: dihydroorotate dehydrogenase [Magnetococcales bacterium]|nr:dihydroorotate dehydrogenase [Magnetococcales bacterium]
MSLDLTTSIAGIPLQSPITLLSGCVGFGEEMLRLENFPFSAVGAIFLKGTTLHPKAGNRLHRIAETPGGMLNAIGLQNPGAQRVVEEILPRVESLPTRLIANIAGSTVEEYAEVARIFDQSCVSAIEINISCPNVKEGGAAFGSDPLVASRVVEAVRKVTTKPVITKLSPNVTDIAQITRAVIEAGTQALSAINTLMGMSIDVRTHQPVLGNVQGGLSGPAIKPVALLKVWQTYQVARKHGIDIVGQGGIASGEDALSFLLVGSRAVGLGTELFQDPWAPQRVLDEMSSLMIEQNRPSIQQWVGGLQSP